MPPAAAPDRTLVLALRERLRAETGAPVQLVETHISWLLLTERHAYKLKQPVRLPFLDFSTLAARRHYCEEELRLNRRLAPSLYLDVLPVRGTPQAPRLDDGDGAPIDWALRMRRFAPGALLEEQLAAGKLAPATLERFAQRLADFHRDAPVAPEGSGHGTPQRVARPVLELLDALRGALDPAPAAWLRTQSAALAPLFEARRQAGAVRECHGDLHLANVVQLGADEVTAFDCIEFDPALRWIDTISDAAFLSMDLQARGARGLAFRFLDAYLQRGGDYAGVRLLRWYEAYRALVRALVARLRPPDAAGDEAPPPDYLACAARLAAEDGAARLLITCGLSGSGKSTVAARLLEAAGAIRLRSDVERKRLFGLDALQRSGALDIYTPDATRRTFERLREGARAALEGGRPVIVDAAFLRRAERQAFRALAAELGLPFAILHCRAGEATLRARVAARDAAGADASEAGLAVLERQLRDHEPLDGAERAFAFDVDTEGALDVPALAARWQAQAAAKP